MFSVRFLLWLSLKNEVISVVMIFPINLKLEIWLCSVYSFTFLIFFSYLLGPSGTLTSHLTLYRFAFDPLDHQDNQSQIIQAWKMWQRSSMVFHLSSLRTTAHHAMKPSRCTGSFLASFKIYCVTFSAPVPKSLPFVAHYKSFSYVPNAGIFYSSLSLSAIPHTIYVAKWEPIVKGFYCF